MVKGYTTEALIEQYTLTDIASSFSAQISSWIEAMEEHVDNETGRNFIADTAATARVYDGDGEHDILIDDCVEVTLVEVGEDDYGGAFSTVPSTGSTRYFLEPANYSAKKMPITKIVLQHRPWTHGKQNNRVTAKWGYSVACPEAITFATTVLVAGIINAQRKDTKEIASEKIGNYAVTYTSDKEKSDFEQAKAILQKYTKMRL
jgi:hypothetical protein